MVYLYGALHCPSWGPVLRGSSLKFSWSRKIRHWSPFCWNTWYFGWVPYYSHKMGMCYRIMPKRSREICLFFLWFGGRSASCRSFKIHFWVVVFALGRWLGFCVTELLTTLEFSMQRACAVWAQLSVPAIHQCYGLQKLPLQCCFFGTQSYLCKCCGGVVETRSSRSHGVLQQPERAESRKGKKGDY